MNEKIANSKKPSRPVATRLTWWLVVVTMVLLGVHIVLQYLNFVVFGEQQGQIYELSNRFDLDDEISVPTWFSQVLFLMIGAGAWLAAYLQTNKTARGLWSIIAAIGLLISLDEVASLHEFFLQSLHVLFYQDSSPTSSANAWLLITPFVLLAAAWLARQLMRYLPRRIVLLFVAGGAVFLVGAVAFDALTSVVPRNSFINQGVLVAIEETLELLGAIIVLYAIANYLEAKHYKVLSRTVLQLKADR